MLGKGRISKIEKATDEENLNFFCYNFLNWVAFCHFDVQYIICGAYADLALCEEERELIRHYRNCDNKNLQWFAHAALCADDCNEFYKIVNFNNNNNIYNVNIKKFIIIQITY